MFNPSHQDSDRQHRIDSASKKRQGDHSLRRNLELYKPNHLERKPRRRAADTQVFSTWLNSSSTGVARPKIVTDTRNLFFS